MTPRVQTLSLLVLGLVAVATVTSTAQHKADKPQAPIVMEPFQKALSLAMSLTDGVGEGQASFTVPAGRRLNLRFIDSREVYVPLSGGPAFIFYPRPGVDIETSVGGTRVTHSVAEGLLELWGDDSAPITIRVRYPTGGASSVTFEYAISGDLY